MEFREGPPTGAYGKMMDGECVHCPVVHGDEFITRFSYTVTAGHTRKTETHGETQAHRGNG